MRAQEIIPPTLVEQRGDGQKESREIAVTSRAAKSGISPGAPWTCDASCWSRRRDPCGEPRDYRGAASEGISKSF